MMQSQNLREIASIRDPIYRSGADLFEINMEYDITPTLTFTSQTVLNNDKSYSFQDYNRRSEEHTSELQSLMRISYAVFCLKKKKHNYKRTTQNHKSSYFLTHRYNLPHHPQI